MNRALPLALLLLGCVGTETGNPPLAAALTARSSDPTVASLAPAADAVVIELAWISVDSARVVDGTACDRLGAEAVLEGVTGDLASSVDTGGLPEVTGCGLNLRFAPPVVVPDGAPPALVDHAFVMRGNRRDGAPFELTATLDHGVDVVADAPRSFTEDRAIVLAADAAVWLMDVDLELRAADPDGVVRFGASDAETLAVEAGVLRSFDVFVDVDMDGVASAAEISAGAVATSHR